MDKHGIPRRSTSQAGMKYAKTSFSGGKLEASYLLGLRVGDLNVAVSGFQIRAATTSSHSAMWRLFKQIFGEYGRVGKSASLSKGHYAWCLYSYLNKSFEFLLEKQKAIPAEILRDRTMFLSFLAGYLDAEGSFSLKNDGTGIAVSLRINSEDEVILRQITRYLRDLGYHVFFSLASSKGEHGRKKYNNDLWQFGMFRSTEVTNLIRSMPMLHDEKIRMANLILAAVSGELPNPGDEAKKLRQIIKEEVIAFTDEARTSYEQKHGPSPSN